MAVNRRTQNRYTTFIDSPSEDRHKNSSVNMTHSFIDVCLALDSLRCKRERKPSNPKAYPSTPTAPNPAIQSRISSKLDLLWVRRTWERKKSQHYVRVIAENVEGGDSKDGSKAIQEIP